MEKILGKPPGDGRAVERPGAENPMILDDRSAAQGLTGNP